MEKSKDPDFIPNLINQLLNDENTPKNIREFNEKIRYSFGTVAETENTGLRPLELTNPRCGNCNFICVSDPKMRKNSSTC